MKNLSQTEGDKLIDAIPLIAAYVAFADGRLDDIEVHSAKRIAKLRRFSGEKEPAVRNYFKEVFSTFDDRFHKLVDTLPNEEQARKDILENKLKAINPILEKLDPLHAFQLYKSFKSFAKHVAKSEGGFLGMGSTGPRQAKAVELEMLNDPDAL